MGKTRSLARTSLANEAASIGKVKLFDHIRNTSDHCHHGTAPRLSTMKILNIVVITVTILECASLGTCWEMLVIDTDGSPDDAMAILLVLSAMGHASNFQVAGITCTYGNTYEPDAQKNVLKILTIANSSEVIPLPYRKYIVNIPVYGGAQKPLNDEYTPDGWFGEDGFGDFKMTQPIKAKVHQVHAANQLIYLARSYKGLSILALGPLTNIALAISIDPEILNYINKIYIMGGSVTDGAFINPDLSRNFGLDPISTSIVLESKNTKALLFPQDLITAQDGWKYWRTSIFSSANTSITRFLDQAERLMLAESETWTPTDVIAAAGMIWPQLVIDRRRAFTPDMDEAEKKSLIVTELDSANYEMENVEIVERFHVEELMAKIVDYIR